MKKRLLIVLGIVVALIGLSAIRAKLDADAEAQLWAEATDSVL
jgi:hypothetical protein